MKRENVSKKVHRDLVGKIKSGILSRGEHLASTRELAKAYNCHRLTIMKVCQDLMAEGWLESTERSHYRVSDKIPITTSSSPKSLKVSSRLSILAKRTPDFDLERERYKIEFWGGQPDLRLFPKDEFRRVLSASLKRAKPELLNYGMTPGLEPCLREVSNYLRRSRNLLNKEFVITNGSQEALMLIAQAFIKPGDKIAIERKGYPPAWRLFENLGAKLIPIELDSEGLDTEDLQSKLKKNKIKLIYLTPLHQYPTTVTLSPRRRQSLIQLAERNLIPILEDDYDHEFHYQGLPPPPLSTETDLGIYVCSFSKIVFPGARLGVIGCDSSLLINILYQKLLASRQTDSLTQIGLSAWIQDGGFERHLRKMRRIYELRGQWLNEKLEKLKLESNISWSQPTGGMSLWVNLHQDSKKVAERARKEGVLFQYEASMDYVKSTGTHLRIGFAGVNEKEIDQGLLVLKSVL